MNRYSPCVPVSTARSSFDSLLESTTVAPAITLPLGSVTVPCSEVDEVCGKTAPLTVSTTKIDKSRYLTRFMVPSPVADSHAATKHDGQQLAHTACWPAIATHFGICPNRLRQSTSAGALETCLG